MFWFNSSILRKLYDLEVTTEVTETLANVRPLCLYAYSSVSYQVQMRRTLVWFSKTAY